MVNLLQEKHNLEWQLAQANLKIKNLEEQLNKLTKQTMISEEIGVNPGTSNPPAGDNKTPVPMPAPKLPKLSDLPDIIRQLPAELWDRIRPGRRPRTVQEGYEILSEYVNQNGIEGLEQYLNEAQAGPGRWLRQLIDRIFELNPPIKTRPGSTPMPMPKPQPPSMPGRRPELEPPPIQKDIPWYMPQPGQPGYRPHNPVQRPPKPRPSGSPRPGTAPGGVSSDQPSEYYDFPGLPQ